MSKDMFQMKINRLNTANLFWVVLLIFSTMLVILGCDSSTNGYKTFTLKRGVGHFTFEYPANYEKLLVYVSDSTNVNFGGPLLTEEEARTLLMVTVIEWDNGVPDLEASVERELYYGSNFEDFKLLDRSSLHVADMQAEQIVFFYKRPIYEPRLIPRQPVPSISREVCFVNGRLDWSIRMRSHESMAEVDRLDFEHILQTFRILN